MTSNRAGQSTAEYAVLIAIVIAGIVGMQTYVKRGLQARYKVASDKLTQSIGAPIAIGGATLSLRHTVDQYEPYYAIQDLGTQRDQIQIEEFTSAGTIVRSLTKDETKRGIASGVASSPTATSSGRADERKELTRDPAKGGLADDKSWEVTP